MAFPLDSDQKALIYEIFGVPQQGDGFYAAAIATIMGPFGQAYTFTTIITQLDALLAALTTYQCTRVTIHTTRWGVIGSTSQIVINEGASGAKGVLVDYPAEREEIRQSIAKIIGFWCPEGGFLNAFNRSNEMSR
jgi:hypothetical protein